MTILEFWFGTLDSEGMPSPETRKSWFVKDEGFDQRLRRDFEDAIKQAKTGEMDEWKEAPESSLALTILLDQFSRNIYRNKPESFAQDSQALSIALAAIEAGFDQKVLPIQRVFFYLPLEHSESLEHQNRSVALFQKLAQDHPNLSGYLDYALQHRDIIQRFGRFPHRNNILGRESTSEEKDYLDQPGSGF